MISRRSSEFRVRKFLDIEFIRFKQVLAALGIAIAAIAISVESSQAQDRFSCDTNQMSTMVNTERGSIPLIRWIDPQSLRKYHL